MAARNKVEYLIVSGPKTWLICILFEWEVKA
jgi:hypothetical protein